MQRIFKSTFNKYGKRTLGGPQYEDEEHEVQFLEYSRPHYPTPITQDPTPTSHGHSVAEIGWFNVSTSTVDLTDTFEQEASSSFAQDVSAYVHDLTDATIAHGDICAQYGATGQAFTRARQLIARVYSWMVPEPEGDGLEDYATDLDFTQGILPEEPDFNGYVNDDDFELFSDLM